MIRHLDPEPPQLDSFQLEQSLRDRTAVVGVVGLGYVGLPLIRSFVAAGFRTMGFDIDQSKVDRLLAGESYIGHISPAWIGESLDGQRFEPTADMRRLCEADVVLICVPTPLSESRDPDLSYIRFTMADGRRASARAARRAGEHHLSRHDRATWCCRSSRRAA